MHPMLCGGGGVRFVVVWWRDGVGDGVRGGDDDVAIVEEGGWRGLAAGRLAGDLPEVGRICSFDSRQALLIANSIELGRPPGIKRLSNPLKILVAPDSSNPVDSE
ncbi:hypothetical protein Tco_0537609 [Tanacetum coccineum]